ncbi:MAG: hypothetical protein U0441_24740 [Polyangiaceae bacterium]
MALSPAHRNLLLGQAIGSVLLNIPLNGGAAWATFPPIAALPVFAKGNCVAGDTIGTSFFLPLTTCLILTPIVRRVLRSGAVKGLARADLPGYARILPKNFVGRGALVGLLSALTLGVLTLVILGLVGPAEMTRGQVTLYKAVYTAVLGIIVTPLFGYRALADLESAPAKR